jgi:hypothetical protein
LRIYFIFAFSYFAVDSLYLVGFREWGKNPVAIFLTSPYNPLETTSRIYNSVLIGEVYNFFVVGIIIATTEVYCRGLSKVFRGVVSIEWGFIACILSSYITSALTWYFYGHPSSGTSIVGFGMLSFLAIGLLFDSIRFIRNRAGHLNVRTVLEELAYYISVALTFAFDILLYVIGNPSVLLHLIGGVFIVVILSSFIFAKKRLLSDSYLSPPLA